MTSPKVKNPPKTRLLVIRQKEPYQSLLKSGAMGLAPEYAYMMAALADWRTQFQEVGILGWQSNKPYNEVLPEGVRLIGSGRDAGAKTEEVVKLAADFCPTHAVIQIPDPKIFRWAIHNQIKVMALFEQTFFAVDWQQKWHHYRLSQWLNHTSVHWVANQGLRSCQSLQEMGVEPQKIIPWSWPKWDYAETCEPKQLRTDLTPLKLAYVGPINTSKGVGDLLIAVAQLRSQNIPIQLKLLGQGDIERFRSQARQLQLADCLEWFESLPTNALHEILHDADLIVLPSRHESLETNTSAIHHALASRTPIIASDHPLFVGSFTHGVNALIFPAGNARALAHRIERLTHQPQLYAQLSEAAHATWECLQLPVKWADLIDRWIHPSVDNQKWLHDHALATGRYRLATLSPKLVKTTSTPKTPAQKSA
jgi:glycosyltransferase involved in cell wall biosynthesis